MLSEMSGIKEYKMSGLVKELRLAEYISCEYKFNGEVKHRVIEIL